MNRELIEKTEEFLKAKLSESLYFQKKPASGEYRLQHSYRVANIGKMIAEKEGFDVTDTVIACLLHDVAYCNDFATDEEHAEHGRVGAKITRAFLEELGLSEDRIQDICYGIAIHVDDKADFEGERTPLALTVGDADNIDHFDAYRLYEDLSRINYKELKYDEKLSLVEETLIRLHKYLKMEFGTKTATEIWKEKVTFYISFYEKLKEQLNNSLEINV